MQKRYGSPAENIPPAHPAWDFETRYTAYAIANIVCILSPQRVIVGGGVTKAGQLGEEWFFKSIQEKIRVVLKGYIVSPFLRNRIGDYIVPPLLGDQAGICGAIALGQSLIASYIKNCR